MTVQERYEALRAMYSQRVYGEDAYLNVPEKDTGKFVPIHLMLQVANDPSFEITPEGLLNFYNPSEMVIHDDYYENYGIEGIEISEMYAGVGTDANVQFPIKMGTVELKGWGTNPTWHERLKQGYYDLQELWKDKD